jgi:alpha-D-xyloside xylohydrolase
MVSVWSKFDNKTKFFKQMNQSGFMLNNSVDGTHGREYYDAWNPKARELFYQFSRESMFAIGVDSLWLDATEPEEFPNVNRMNALGSGNALMNSYSLMTNKVWYRSIYSLIGPLLTYQPLYPPLYSLVPSLILPHTLPHTPSYPPS